MTKSLKEIFQYCLAALIVLGEFAAIYATIYILLKGFPQGADQSFMNIVSGLVLGYHSTFVIVVMYFFGSTMGSARKTEIMSEQNNGKING